MEEYGIYVGKKTGKRSPRSGVPLWKWTLVKRQEKKPSDAEIKELIDKNTGLMGYAMRLKPRPWKKMSKTIKV
jgi:hypothetical protein